MGEAGIDGGEVVGLLSWWTWGVLSWWTWGGSEAREAALGGEVGLRGRRRRGEGGGGGAWAAAARVGRVGDLAREGERPEGNMWSGGGLAMAHLPLVHHKYDDSNGAPPPVRH